MPELVLFKRRWHVASDTLPVMTALLCIFHILWFIPYASGAWSIETTGVRFDCEHGALLRVANYSLFALFGCAAVVEAVLTVVGLQGGPFQTRKRRAVKPLFYLEVALWFLLLCFTVFSTVVVSSPKVNAACWSNNPCQYNSNELPLACRDKNGKATQDLSPACLTIVEAGPDFMNVCWTDWLVYGANWVVEIQNSANKIYEEVVKANEAAGANSTAAQEAAEIVVNDWADRLLSNDTYLYSLCNSTADSEYWYAETGLELDVSDDDTRTGANMFTGFANVQDYNAFLEENPDLFAMINNAMLDELANNTIVDLRSLDGNYTRASDMYWYSCLSPTCQAQTQAADECEQWAQILMLPNPSDKKKFFVTLVATSWAVLGVTALVLFMCFNAFPDYDDVDSWEGTIRSMGRMLCCGGVFTGSAEVGGSNMSVSHEIAKSLNLLFGGIDLDPTDRLLGIYLVSERQHRRRQQDVLTALQRAGYAMERRPSKLTMALRRLTSKPKDSEKVATASDLGHQGSMAVHGGSKATLDASGTAANPGQDQPAAAAGSEDGLEAPLGVPLVNNSSPAAAVNGAVGGDCAADGAAAAQQQHVPAAFKLPPSPFEAAERPSSMAGGLGSSPGPAGSPGGQQQQQPGSSKHMWYQHSMLRLRSTVPARAPGGLGGLDLAAVEEGRQHEAGRLPGSEEAAAAAAGVDPPEPEHVLEPSRGAAAGAAGKGVGLGLHKPGAMLQQKDISSWQNSAIRVTSRFHPLLTPSGCAGGSQLMDPPLSPQAAADIYAGKLEPVDFETLREAQRISRFAVASYGLQSVIWAQGKRPSMCMANANRLVKCFKKPFGLESKFRKRNFDAILEITGVQPSDLLYVSYTNIAGGVLPYIIMLHRPSKSVVLSVRGTVSMEDLVTDLLSNPDDVSGWVPEWVLEEAARRQAAFIAGDASGSSLKAHIGIVSSATAILKDMEERGLLRELLLSKLLRAATSTGRNPLQIIDEFMASHPLHNEQQQSMKRGGAAGGDPVGAAAAGAGLREAASSIRAAAEAVPGAAGEAREQQQEFVAAEQQHVKRINQMDEEREVVLPLERAQTIIRSKLQQQGWKFVVTGHSLGAAVACMLGMQLRERFTDLKCWAFNPPGGLLSWELSQIAQTFCTSTVVGKDVISRLSFNTSKRVVDEMVVSLARCTRPKLKIVADMMLGRRKQADSTPHTFCSFDQVAPEALQLVEQYYRASRLHMQTADTTEMYPPGKLVFLRPFKGKQKQQTVWDAVWVDAATLISEGILVTPSMMAHHRLFVLADAFQSIFADEAATQVAAQHEQGEGDLL